MRVERHYASGLPLVPLDESLCEQAFLNLVQNAYEAMQDRDHGGTLRVEVQPATQNDREGVELRLADTGPGVPEELREEIFNPFVTTKKTGVGLGLSIVSKIVDGHHGSIHVENAPGGRRRIHALLSARRNRRAEAVSTMAEDGRLGCPDGRGRPALH